MTTNPYGNGDDTPIHDRTVAAEAQGIDPATPAPWPFGEDETTGTDPLRDDLPSAGTDPLRDDSAVGTDPLRDDLSTGVTSSAGATGTGTGADVAGAVTAGAGATAPALGTGDHSGGAGSTGGGKADAAKGAAQDVAGDAKEKAADVAGTAKEQVSNLASEATDHARELFGQASSTLKDQAGQQQQKAASGLRGISEQLGRMAENDEEQGIASRVVHDLSNRAGSVAGYLEGRDPGSLVDEVKSFAARRPGTFIAIAAGAGILAGRLAKALATEVKHEHERDQGPTGTSA